MEIIRKKVNLKNVSRAEVRQSKKTKNKSILSSALALAGIGGGLLAIFFGFVFIIIHAILEHDTIFNQIGTFLTVISIPMILVGSIFLDKFGENK